jgi:hypothetical protein
VLCGVGLIACLLTGRVVPCWACTREQMGSGLPVGLQPDWEGILTARPSDFVRCLRSAWIDSACRPTNLLDVLPPVQQVCPTLRHMLLALNSSGGS